MARPFFANYRKTGRKAQLKYGKRWTVLCNCNNVLDRAPERFKEFADDGTCRQCGRRPWIDLR